MTAARLGTFDVAPSRFLAGAAGAVKGGATSSPGPQGPTGKCTAARGSSPALQPGHHGPQFRADGLDLVGPALFAEAVEVRRPGVHLVDELLGERAAADIGQQLAHGFLRRGADDALAPGQVAVLGG